MGRTIPSFRIALYQEEKKWSIFRSGLDVKDKKYFDELFASGRLYISACMMSCRPIRIESILMSMIFHHFKQILCLGGEIESFPKR
jgi:hypothetical protein